MIVDFVRIVARAATLRAQAKANLQEANGLLDSLGDLDVREYPADQYILKVQVNHTFDAATAKKNLTPEQYSSILKPTPNSALAKALLDDQYYLCQRQGENKRIIVEVKDED